MSIPAWAVGLDLPDDVLALVEFPPTEDVLLDVLRTRLPSIPAFSLIPENPPPLFILVRKDHSTGVWKGDNRFLYYARMRIDVFAVDPDGDEKGAVVSDVIRRVFRDAMDENHYVPDMGWVHKLDLRNEGSRKTDWATASGPVQYADLPTGYWRYESKYDLYFRRQINN